MSCRSEQAVAGGWQVAGSLTIAVLLAFRSVSPAVGQSPVTSGPSPATSYTPHRVYDTRGKQFLDFETLVGRLAAAELVFVGEQHDDPATHRMELAILEGIARRRDSVVLALEMFERDVQPLLDGYLADSTSEEEFLKGSRPWKNYAGDYRPLVELARARNWPVVASNVPRSLASSVGRAGLAALDTLSSPARSQLAEALACPEDVYYEKFVKVMGDLASHGPSPTNGEAPKARLLRLYQAQCVKDETMGESVARVWRPGRLVVHYNGAFHSDFRLGTAARAKRRASNARLLVVTALPVKDLDRLKPS
ncbi:MAG TPA: ChaN family lipoprotein, partial [Gemmatimonadales bacterium]|nr:ChaN family lipoprotein [Gemmatimonadales bacterium]